MPQVYQVLVAAAISLLWGTFHLKGAPPLTRSIVRVVGEGVMVNDARARRELSYHEVISREAGLSEITPIS